MAIINIQNLSFSYDSSGDKIFDRISFSVDTDWRLGFCGRNGRGKTTLLKLLMGKYEYSGTISSSVSFDYFPLEVTSSDCNVLDILEEIAPQARLWQIQKKLSKLAVYESVLYRPFNTLSNGEQAKVLLACLFLRENSFLLIDEPTNHLDMQARQIVAKYLKSKKGFILVSHDRAFLDECTDHILSINRANIEVVKGNYSTWQENKDRQDAFELSQNRRLEGEISRLEKAATQTARWAESAEKAKFAPQKSGLGADRGFLGAKAAKKMKSSKVIETRQRDAIEEKSTLLKNVESEWKLKIEPLKYHTDRLIEIKDLSISYGERVVLDGFSLSVKRGDRIALRGGNGSGKSSILKLLCGQNISHTGQVQVGSKLIISYVPQDSGFLRGNLKEFAMDNDLDETLFKSILHKLDFTKTQFDKDMQDFSQGQKKKVLIAKSLCKSAHLYIWDEPLNYIDILSRIQIEELILAYAPTMIFVEHDRRFCDNVATGIVET